MSLQSPTTESPYASTADESLNTEPGRSEPIATARLTHLQRLEAESIQIMREAVSESENPVMLYSVGKDSATMLHLARKAFYPSAPPFPLLHVDTTWKFKAMYELRDSMVAEAGMELLVHQNPECIERGINPFDHGSAVHTDMWKTQGLKQALDKYRFDLVVRRGFGVVVEGCSASSDLLDDLVGGLGPHER